MLSPEDHSLNAIGKLQSEFPYAATLLVYVFLERCLKLHLLRNRNSLTENEVELCKPVGRKNQRLVDVRNFDDTSFIQEFLTNCSLGALEIVYRVPGKRYSDHRNKVFHSELYMSEQMEIDYQSRDVVNRQYLETAKKNLIDASEHYFHRRIIESNGSLQFES